MDHKQMELKQVDLRSFAQTKQMPLYTAIVIPEGKGQCKVDSGVYPVEGPAVLFTTPFQTVKVSGMAAQKVKMLQFHGDFYCIEFHKPEVACNGLLFNNVYLSPVLSLNKNELVQIEQIFADIADELKQKNQDRSVLISYLQLFLAVSSRIKRKQIKTPVGTESKDELMEKFKGLIDQHFLLMRRPSQYAKLLHIPVNTLTKRCKKYFAKSPSQLIHERIILEARKELHLTRKSVKEIAFALCFEDEHYFSRFFKKSLGMSPQVFRQKGGISIVADLST